MAQFLKHLLIKLRGSVQPESDRQCNIASNEKIARYILTKKQFSTQKHIVKYAAYLPAPNGETSVYRVTKLTEQNIWEIGSTYVSAPRKKTLYARGDVLVSVVRKADLEILAEATPHPLHANIVSWPSERHEQKILALEIANEAILKIKP